MKFRIDSFRNEISEGSLLTTLLIIWTYALFYRNNFIRTTRFKFTQKLRTSYEQLRLRFRCKCNCKILLKTQQNVARESWEFLVQNCVLVYTLNLLPTGGKTLYLDSQHICSTRLHDGNKNNLRTIEAQIVKNLRTTRLGQNLLVHVKSMYCSKGLGTNRTESQARCLPLQLTDHATGITLLLSRSA